MASKKGAKFTIQGEVLLRANLAVDQVEAQIQKINQGFNNFSLGDKSTKNLEGTVTRIKDQMMALRAQSAKGFLDSDELNEYYAQSKKLTKEQDSLARMMRSMPSSQIIIDSAELRKAQDEIVSAREALESFKKTLEFDTSGYGDATADIIKLNQEMVKAAKNSKSIQEAFDDFRKTKVEEVAKATGTEATRQSEKEQADKRVQALTEEYEAYKKLNDEIKEIGKSGKYSDELVEALKGAKRFTEGKEGLAGLTTNDAKKAKAVELVENQHKKLEAATTAAKKASQEHGKAVAKTAEEAKKLQAIDQFGQNNATKIDAFENQAKDLAVALTKTEKDARVLYDTLIKMSQQDLDALAQNLEKVSAEQKLVVGGVKDHEDALREEKAATDSSVASFKSKITQLFGLYNIYQLIRRGINDAYQSIKKLDTAMNEIAVVTSMTTNELWEQIDTYMAVAKQYGVATQGVYEVSKLYYQQGRQAAEVTLLTAETLKMAKIAGLDYSKATDNMTVALNGFKMSAQDASTIVDVYSKLAAVAAVDTEELAYAMSKTASIAESAGMSFENTSVFLTQMIETTREAPENIGTALKTIIARFQEMKKSPMDIIDVEGEEVSFNKVDQALKTIGMSLQDTSGQFRDLDGVIYELADKWDGLDRNTQRYIATTVAGSRQQSRFLALMQDNSRLQELRVKATESEDAGLIQYSKTLDSLDSKLNQLSTSFQELYMGIINGPIVKTFIDGIRFIVDKLNSLPKAISITLLPAIFLLVRKLLTTIGSELISGTRDGLQKAKAQWSAYFKSLIAESKTTGATIQANLTNVPPAGAPVRNRRSGRMSGSGAGGQGQALTGVAGFASKQATMFSYIYMAIAAISAVAAVVELLSESTEEHVARLKKTAEDANIERAIAKDELTSLTQLKKKYDELNKIQNKTQEQTDEYNTIRTEIADKYPELIDYIDTEGNAVLKMGDAYDSLAKKKKQAYEQAFVDNARAQLALSFDVFAAAAEQGFEGPGNLAEFANYGPEAWVVNSFKNAQNDKRFKSGESKLEDIAREYFNKENSTYTLYENGKARSYDLNNEQERDYASKIGTTYTQLALAAQQSQAGFEVAKESLIQAQTNFALQEADVSSNLAAQQLQKEGDILFAEIRKRKTSEDKTPAELAQIFSSEFAVKIAAQLDKRFNKDILDSDEYKNADEAFTQKDFISLKRFNELMSAGAGGYLEEEEKGAIRNGISSRYLAQEERYASLINEKYASLISGKQASLVDDSVTDAEWWTNGSILDYGADNNSESLFHTGELEKKFAEFQANTSDAAADYLISMTDSALAILSSDSAEKTIKAKLGHKVADDALAFMDAIYGASIDGSAETAGKIQSVLDTQDANSITDLFFLIDALKQMEELDLDGIDDAKNLRLGALVPTVNEKTAALASYISGMEEFNKIDLNDVSMTDALKYIASEQYNFDWGDFNITEDGKIQFKNREKAQSEILGVSQELFDYFAKSDPEWAKAYQNWADSWKQQTDRDKLQSQLGELDFSDTYNDLSVEQADYLNTLLGGNLSFQDVLGGKRLSSDSYDSFIKQLESVAWDMDAGPERTAMLEMIKSLKQAINDSIQDYVDSIIGALDPEKNQAILSEEELKWLGMDASDLESAGIGQYIVQDVNGIIERIREKLKSEGYSNAEIEAEIAKYTEEREDFLKDEAKALSDALLSMLDANAEELLSQANANQFKDENLAKALADRMDGKSVTKTDEGSSIDGVKQGDNIKQIEDYFASRGKNLYDTLTLVSDTEKKLANIANLEKALAKAKESSGKRELALAKQLAAAIHDTIMSAESYNFMGNSNTNDKLAPMYTLMQSTETAITALEEATKSGIVGTENLNAMLDFVGRERFPELDKIAKQLSPPLETAMTPEDAKMLQDAVTAKTKEKVDEYNAYAEGFNNYIDKLEQEKGNTLESGYIYQGNEIENLQQIIDSLEVQLTDAEIQRYIAIGQQNGGTVESFIQQLVSGGIITDKNQENPPVDKNTVAIDNLTTQLGEAKLEIETEVTEFAGEMTQAKTNIESGVSGIKTQFDQVADAASDLSSRLSNIKLVVGSSTSDDEGNQNNGGDSPFVGAPPAAAAEGGLLKKSSAALVGEFGPEIAVVDGQYYLVGKNGPERVNLPQGSFVLNHKETAKVFGKPTRSLGDSFALGDHKIPPIQFIPGPGPGGGGGSGSGPGSGSDSGEEPSKAEFDRWYNYLRLIEDVEQAIAELQAARENLSGTAYTQSQVNEIALLQQQERQVTRLRDAQRKYLTTVNADKIKQYGDVLSVVNGVLQINWDRLQGMDQDQAEPIQAVIAEWEDLNSSISKSNQEIENFQKQIKDIQDAMRDTYIEVERQVIEALKYRQQMIIDNLQDELAMKQKYDNKYLESLRKNIEEERRLRDRSDSEANRVALQRKLALLKRDTSGKSDLAIAETERELREANRDAYDQRQDDYVKAEEDAALAAQKALQLQIEIQTEVLTMMGENVQLIQETVDDLLQSGPVNLTNFLSNWSQEYLNATPTEQQRFMDNNLDKTGQAAGYLSYLSGDMKALIQGFNEGKWFPTTPNGSGGGGGGSGNGGSGNGGGGNPNTKQKYWGIYSGGKRIRSSFRTQESAQNTINSEVAKASNTMYGLRWHTGSQAYKEAEAKYKQYKNATVQQYKSGGLVDYTGPAIVHGSKRKPESVLNARQTPIFQRFVEILDENFGGSTQRSMMKEAPRPDLEGAGTTVVVENINLQPGVISRDYDARRAGDLVKEEILNIAKYKGNMKIGKK